MLRAPHLTHAALTQTLDKVIASQFSSAIELRAQIVDNSCADVCDEHDEQVWEHELDAEADRRKPHRSEIYRHHEADHQWNGGRGSERRRECPAGRAGDNHCKTAHPDSHPGQASPRWLYCVSAHIQELSRRN